MSKLRYASPSLIFKIFSSHRYDVLKEGVQDVKWDQMIFQILQLYGRKIHIRVAAVRHICLLSCYAMHDRHPRSCPLLQCFKASREALVMLQALFAYISVMDDELQYQIA
jgi:hypothetical protein